MNEKTSAYDISYNLFNYGYKELTQDAFICWLIKWAYYDGTGYEKLKECGQGFVKALFKKHGKEAPDNLAPDKVKIWQQDNSIDVLARIGDYVLLIEDKTGTGDHSDQLQRYYDIVSNKRSAAGEVNAGDIIPIYLKTGNQSLYDKLRIEESKKYKVFERREFLDVIKPDYYKAHPVIRDFYNHLVHKEEATNSYEKWRENGNKNEEVNYWLSCQGFFRKLESELRVLDSDSGLVGFDNKDSAKPTPSTRKPNNLPSWGWDYVPNQAGGFIGFWWYYRTIKCDTGEAVLYLQLEMKPKMKPNEPPRKLCFKLAMEDTKDTKWRCLRYISEGRKDLVVKKPRKMGSGYTVTFAVWENCWIKFSPNGEPDISATKKNLITAQCMLDNVVEKLEDQ